MSPAFPILQIPGYRLTLAQSAMEVQAAQRLRYQVFNVELQEGLAGSHATGLDCDAFDDCCDHLLAWHEQDQTVVGTYRLQTGTNAAQHLGYYSEREFVFAPFEKARGEILELGRACVAADHRKQQVLGLLWKGIARYAKAHGVRYLLGCSSLTSRDAAEGLAAYALLAPQHEVAPPWRTQPHENWRCTACGPSKQPVKIPRLMQAYLTLGARICGEPAIDREFGTIDFLTWLDLESLPVRVAQKFLR